MNDLIKRADAIKAINARSNWYQVTCNGKQIAVMLMAKDVNEILEKVPSADRPQGEWIYGEHDVAMCDGYRCDRCGFFVPWDYEHKFIDFINDYHFCPNCGADMRKGADDGTR